MAQLADHVLTLKYTVGSKHVESSLQNIQNLTVHKYFAHRHSQCQYTKEIFATDTYTVTDLGQFRLSIGVCR